MKPFIRPARLAVTLGLLGLFLGLTAQAGILGGINHTHWAINSFSVDGRSALDIIGPWQGGGGGTSACQRGGLQGWRYALIGKQALRTPRAFPALPIAPSTSRGLKKSMHKLDDTADQCRCPTTAVRTFAASQCISFLAMKFRSLPPVIRMAAPSTRSRPRWSYPSRSPVRSMRRL